MRFLYVERTSGKAQSTTLTLSFLQQKAQVTSHFFAPIHTGYIL